LLRGSGLGRLYFDAAPHSTAVCNADERADDHASLHCHRAAVANYDHRAIRNGDSPTFANRDLGAFHDLHGTADRRGDQSRDDC
jgi:hypothetical protein